MDTPWDCCVPHWPIQLTPCREFGFPKSSERVHLNQEFSWENFQRVFKTLQVFHWTRAREKFAHSQPLVSAGHWKIRISGHLQGLLLREGKGNLAGSPLGATVQGMKGRGDVPRTASPQPSLHQSPAEFPVLSSAGGSRLSWCPPPNRGLCHPSGQSCCWLRLGTSSGSAQQTNCVVDHRQVGKGQVPLQLCCHQCPLGNVTLLQS